MSTKPQSFKDSLKELAPAYIISFSLSFMLLFYEPVNTFAHNTLSFWYDISQLLLPVLGIFGISFVGIAAIFTIVYIICRKLGKLLPYKIFAAVVIFLFFPLYMQNTFFNMKLPVLDGSPIDWDKLRHLDILFLMFVIGFGIIFVYCIIKFGTDKILKYASLISLAVFVMLTSSLVVTIMKNNAYMSRNNIITTNKNFSTMSSEKNFVIFVVDTISAGMFDEVLCEDTKYADVFDDFTFYTDTMSVYPYTIYSVPLILTGETVSASGIRYTEFCTDAYNNSTLFSLLDENGYDINLYENFLLWAGEPNFEIKNGESVYGCNINFGDFSSMARYLWFKFVPYTLKGLANIETVNLQFGTAANNDIFLWDNDIFYHNVKDNSNLEKQQRNTFQFIHTEGAHMPFIYDENVNKVDGGTSYNESVKATITTIKAYIDRLKANGLYDNTAIVIAADHGHTDTGDDGQSINLLSRLNPILLIKGVNEKHELIRSDLPLIQTDLMDAYQQLLDGKQSTDLFTDIEKSRTRTVLIHADKYIFTEYTTDGKATEYDKFIPTGNVYENLE